MSGLRSNNMEVDETMAETQIDQTAQALAEMMTENTGRALMDSGGTPKFDETGKYVGSTQGYGRQWERNQGKTVADFESEPVARLEQFEFYSASMYHFLKENLTYVPEYDEAFQNWLDKPENEDESWLSLMEKFAADEIGGGGLYGEGTPWSDNSYNHECVLDGTVQFTFFSTSWDVMIGDTEIPEGTYVLLQIHGGADVRGGYTRPRLFEVDDENFLSMSNGLVRCEGTDPNAEVPAGQSTIDGETVSHERIVHTWYTDDTWNWYPEGVGTNQLTSDNFAWDDEIEGFRCPECGTKMLAS